MLIEYDCKKVSKDLLSFIDGSPSCYHAIKNISDILESKGYTRLIEGSKWNLEKGKGYYVTRNASSVMAFRIPEGEITGFNIAASHSDFPCFKLKDNCVISGGEFIRLNTEKYGGMICSTWLDRPLSVAGRVVVEEEGAIKIKLVNIDRDLLLIPNVAIHMNGKVNDGFQFNAAVDTVPLYGLKGSEKGIKSLVAECAGVNEDAILGTDLFIYSRLQGTVWGGEEEFISSRSLDDLQCAFSNLEGFLASETSSAVPVFACFDNEEVGSSTKQGAASTFLYDTLRRICINEDEESFRCKLASSFLLSCDNAHSVHPNHGEYADGQNKVVMNGGIVIKFNAAQKYTTDSVSESVVKLLCKRGDIPYQAYANRSNMGGGSTLGGIATTKVSINAADIGLAQLAMHSSYETAGIKDTAYLIELSRIFFETPINAGDNCYNI